MTIRRSGELFFTVTPSFWTVSGSRGVAMATRFCVSTCAVSRLVPRRKVTVRSRLPSPVDWLEK